MAKLALFYFALVFYSLLGLFLGLIDVTPSTTSESAGTFRFDNIITNITEAPVWVNVLFIVPLFLIIIIAVLTSLPTVSVD